MSMITRCPSCGTAFRVTPPQLQAQHGMVRCGRCATVFDGFKTLAMQRDDSPPAPAAPPPGDAAPPASFELQGTAPPSAADDHGDSGMAEALAPPPGDAAPPASFELQDAAPPPEPAIAAPPQAVVAPEPQAKRADAAVEAAPLPRRRSGWLGFGILLLVFALAAQGIYFYRGEIAANVPEARPYLDKMCRQLGCSVALPQRPRAISIEASDLQATDAANPGLIVLTATLRNQVTTAVGYPALDVVLTNAKEHTVARRIFLPSEYLDAGKDLRGGIPPNAEMTIKLNIDSGDLGAAGFRLDLLASPVR